MGNLSEHFSTWEFECGCGCGECCPSNGTRCAHHNEMIGGSENSSHVPSENALGQSLSFAVDVFVANSGDAYRLVDAAMQAGFDRIGFKLRSGFIHLDCDPQKSRPHMWGYPG